MNNSLFLSLPSLRVPGRPVAGVGSNSPHLSASSGHSHGMVNGQKSLELCSHSPDGRQPSPLTSPLLNDACSVRTDDEDEVRRKVCDSVSGSNIVLLHRLVFKDFSLEQQL